MSRERTGPRRVLRLVRGQLRLRVLIAVVSLSLVTLAAFDVAAVTALHNYLTTRTDTTSRTAAPAARPQLAETVFAVDGGRKIQTWVVWSHQLPVAQYSVLHVPHSGIPSEVNDGPGAPLVFSVLPPLSRPSTIVYGQPHGTVPVDGQQLGSVAISGTSGTSAISTSPSDVNHTMDRMRLILLIGSAVALVLIGLGVFWLLRRGLRPIETMAAQADRITAGDLTDRVTEQDPGSEVGRLGSALNGMLARIEASVHERETGQELMRRFFADASHELRTPLASLRANAELYQQGALSERGQVDEVMRRIALEARRMSGLVDDMLRLARLDQHPDQHREPVELTELVAGCVDRIRVAAPEHQWHTEIAPGVVAVGDAELLRRAVDNLLVNVLAHTPPATTAIVALREREGAIEIEVSDDGPGVPEDRLPRIFDRFYRADTTTPRPGSGLGLAIVTQILTVHNGTVTAGPNAPHGLRVRLSLPVRGGLAFTHDSHNSPAAV